MQIFHHGFCHVLLLFTLVTCSCVADDQWTLYDDDNDDDDAPYFTNEFAVLVKGGMDVARGVALEHGYQLKNKIGSLPDYYILHHEEIPVRSRRGTDDYHTKKLADDDRVEWFQQQEAKTRSKRDVVKRTKLSFDFNDPLYEEEWYLDVQDETERNLLIPDMHIKKVWEQGITGAGVVVAIVDDGLETDHTDLARNYDPQASWNFKENRQDPTPPAYSLSDNGHGTRCAGEVSMEANNDKCGVGIAFDAKIGGIRIIDGKVTDADEGGALSFNVGYVDIYSASWGPSDDGETTDVPGPLAQAALEQGIREGRHGKGVLYSWASGNGGKQDDCNCDGYSSSIYTIATASASETGHKTYYGEKCSSILTTTYSSGSGSEHSVISTDINDSCTTAHGGTSAAAPMTAGVLALLLQTNPDLTWRDVQHIIVQTSSADRLQTEPHADWRQNAAGHTFSDYFGFGLLDAEAMVSLANPETWINYPEKSVCTVEADAGFNTRVISKDQNLNLDIQTNACNGTSDEVKYLEHVVLYVTTEYSKRGALNIHLTSPSGTETILLSERSSDFSSKAMINFPLMSVQLWGEDPSYGDGNWRLEIFDSSHGGEHSGSLLHWKLELHGTKNLPQ